LATCKMFGGCRLVYIDMGQFGTQYRVERSRHGRQRGNIGPGSIVDEEYLDIRSKQLFETIDGTRGVFIRAVGWRMTLVRVNKGLRHFGMYPRIVIARKCLHGHTVMLKFPPCLRVQT